MRIKEIADLEEDPLDHEIDFSDSYPNPLLARFSDIRNFVVIEPEMLELFPDSAAVNGALRELIALREKSRPEAKVKRASFEVRARKKK